MTALAQIGHAVSWLWAQREIAVANATMFLVAYFTLLPSERRANIERNYPRWGGLVQFIRDVFPFLPGVPQSAKQIITGERAPSPAESAAEEIARRGSQIKTLQDEVAKLQREARPRTTTRIESAPPAEIAEGAKPAETSIHEAHDSDGSNGDH